MKKLFILAAGMFLCLAMNAQTSGGPDAYGYSWKNNLHTAQPPAYSWFDITSIGTLVDDLADDNFSGPYSASGFQYYWYQTPQLWIGSNGYISFGPSNIASPFPVSIPLSSGANNFIAPYLADLNFSGANNPATCYYYWSADTICVSFINVPFWENSTSGYTGSNTFQIILNQVDKSITFNYQSMSLGNVVTQDNAIGIENNSGTLGLGVMYDSSPANLSTYKFYYPGTVTYAVTDGGVNWVGNDQSGGVFIRNGVPHALKSNIKNFGNQVLGGFTVRDTVVNQWNVPYTNGSMTLSGLPVGNDTTITFLNSFTPPAGGTFQLNTSISGITGDLVPSNNRSTQELISIDTTLAFMVLDYSDGVPDGTGLGWNGGGGGVGIYIEPPSYPVRILSSRFMVTANATAPVGFIAKIFDDDGPNGSPGTQLDSVYVPPASVLLNTYTSVIPFDTNIVISSGGVYLLWEMGGPDINIGRDITKPISRRTYEVLGGTWSPYRDKYTEDFLLGIVVEYAGPKADFNFDNSQDPAVSFLDMSSDNPTTWYWDFDDGTSSTLQNPVHTFIGIDNYNVCLTVTNAIGSGTKCRNISITNGPPLSDFTFILTASPTISFIDQTAGQPSSWSWDFDDAGNDSSNVQHPVYQFKSNGAHNVCLTTSNVYGAGTPKCKTVNVTGVGIEEVTASTVITVSPNPFSDMTVISLTGEIPAGQLRLVCMNSLGQVVKVDHEIATDRIIVNANGLTLGLYYFELMAGDEKIGSGRLILQ